MKNKIIINILVTILIILSALIIKNLKSENEQNQEQEYQEVEIIEEKEDFVSADYIETLEDGTLQNKSEKLKENKIFDELEITRIVITGNSDKMTMVIDVQNKSSQTKNEKDVTLIMKDKDNEEIGRIGLNLSELKPQQAVTLELETEIDFVNTYDIEIIEEKLTL